MDDGGGSEHSGHVLSYLRGMSGSEEDIENQLPFDHNAMLADGSDNSDDELSSPSGSDEESEDEEYPCDHEWSIMEDVRALIEYAMPSELGASPFQLGNMSPPRPLAPNEGFQDHQTASALAKAAMLMPVAMDTYTLEKDPENAGKTVSLRRGILSMVTLFALLTCASMHFVLEIYTGFMKSAVADAANDALSYRSAAIDKIVRENFTSDNLKEVLSLVGKSLTDSIQIPADRALESVWGSLRSLHAFNESWDGSIEVYKDPILYGIFAEFDSQWHIQDGPFRSDNMAVSEDRPPKNQLKSLSIIRRSGEILGMAGSSYTVDCPRSGPAVCGSCIGMCKDLDVYAFGSEGASNQKDLVSRKVNLSSGLPVGQPLLVEPLVWRDRPEFKVQQQAAEASRLGGASSITKLWSSIHHIARGALRMAWTIPLAYCGSYSCFDGVVSAEVMLDHISHECTNALSKLQSSLDGMPINAGNASVFVVNHISKYPDQLGLLLGSAEWSDSSQQYLPRNATDLEKHEPEQTMVAAASRAILAKFHKWDANLLTMPQVLSFRKSYALKGELVECGFNRINIDVAGGRAMDCLHLATSSLELGNFTRWLVVAVVADGTFNAHSLFAQQSALAVLEDMNAIAHDSINQARMTSSVVLFVVGFILLVIGALLAWCISEPMFQLCKQIQQMDDFQGILPELFEVPNYSGFGIKDVADAHRAFRNLASGIRAFSLFIPEEVVKRIIYGEPRSIRPHVDSRNVTVMFTGIRDIIRMSLNEEQMLSVITRFHKIMTSIVEQYEGTVGEILDEGLLVYFNAPRLVTDHASRACEAGLAQRQAMNTLRQELVDDGWLDPSDAFLRLGVGIHTGNVLVGCIGSTMKMKFGCIGDAMNLTSRLQGLCKFYDVDVMCSEETWMATTSLVCRKVDHLQVKGRQETTAVYEVMGHDTLEGAGALTPAQTPTPAAAFGKSLPASPRNDDSPPISPAQMIGKPNALTLPIPSSGRERKKGPPKFLPPETHSPSLLNPISRSPRRGNIPDVIGRQTSLSPERTTPGAIGDRTNRTYCGGGTSTAASASYYPSPSPESAGSEEGSRYLPTSRGGRSCPSSSLSPTYFDQVTAEQKAFKAEYEAALDAYQNSRFDDCVEMCRALLKSKPDDKATLKLMQKALDRGEPAITVMHEK
ncbi:unnamed protein product [Durusdinium trenchii]|uniref:Guanylate cyclase domain-containing protein n=2 Tax=Durusdinium trenchii TaxID=1381693 RepID=A0ABP0H8I1_9DINO